MLSGPILLTLSYLSGSFYQLVHTTDTASAASGQQEPHFTRSIIYMLRKQDLT